MNPGDQFGRLTFLRESEEKYKGVFQCICGTVKDIWIGNVKSKDTVSCGCERQDTTASLKKSHGLSGTPLYQCWKDMRRRSTEGSSYHDRRPTYASVRHDPRWDSFEEFAKDMGDTYFEGACLARYGDTGDYTKDNCRWLTKSENSLEMWSR